MERRGKGFVGVEAGWGEDVGFPGEGSEGSGSVGLMVVPVCASCKICGS